MADANNNNKNSSRSKHNIDKQTQKTVTCEKNMRKPIDRGYAKALARFNEYKHHCIQLAAKIARMPPLLLQMAANPPSD